jgi:hypothetical protein
MRISRWVLITLLIAPLDAMSAGARQSQTAPPSDPQLQQQDSLAAAARQARVQKKDQPKSKKVWDNDNIPELGPSSVVGNEARSAAEEPGNSTDKQAQPASGAQPNDLTKKVQDHSAAIDAAKANLESLKADLDILQRKYSLDQQDYYGRTDYSSDKAGAAALQDEQNDIDAKQQEVEEAQKKLDDLQALSGNTPPADNTAK